MPIVRIRRPSQCADYFRNYRIYVDGSLAGEISAGAEICFDVLVGQREIWATTGSRNSNSIYFTAEKGIYLTLEVGANLTGWRAVFSYFYSAPWRSSYLYLRKIRTRVHA